MHYFFLSFNRLKYYLKYAFKAVHILEILDPRTSLPCIVCCTRCKHSILERLYMPECRHLAETTLLELLGSACPQPVCSSHHARHTCPGRSTFPPTARRYMAFTDLKRCRNKSCTTIQGILPNESQIHIRYEVNCPASTQTVYSREYMGMLHSPDPEHANRVP